MNSYIEIDAPELNDMIASGDLMLIDVRNDDEVLRSGLIPSAKHLPLAILPADIDSLMGNNALVFYCHSGIRSAQASAYLVSKGRMNVYNLRGGVLAWGKSGFSFDKK